MNSSLRNASVIGFFSTPSPSLAEHNPSAYSAAVAALPAGSGCCSQCGNGIVHHVVIRDEAGTVRFIGTDCAKKIGGEVETAVRVRKTSEELAAIAARDAARDAAWRESEARRLEAEAANREKFADILAVLESKGSEFHSSLAAQLIAYGRLSWRQAEYAAKATSETGRRNKRNAAAWDEIIERVQGDTSSPAA